MTLSARPIAAPMLAALAFVTVLLAPRPARAHEFRPGSLDVFSTGDGRYEVEWDPPPGSTRSQPEFPGHCARRPLSAGASATDTAPADTATTGAPAASAAATGPAAGAAADPDPAAPPSDRRFSLDCAPSGLEGSALTITGLAPLRDEVLVRVRLDGGDELTAMLTAAHPSFRLPSRSAPSSAAATVASYAWAGADHLLTGLDHALFLLGLLLLVQGRPSPTGPPGGTAPLGPGAAARMGPLVRAITAFTLAHSLTLALQVLGAVRLPPPPVEAAIALSVLFLARELLRPPASPTLVHRRPWVAAFGFGLLHGLGFAGGLAAHHLPQARIPAALLGFNLGLEAAQLGLVVAALGLGRALPPLAARLSALRSARSHPARGSDRPRPSLPSPRSTLVDPALRPGAPHAPWTRVLPAYALGAVAAFWLVTRIAAFRP